MMNWFAKGEIYEEKKTGRCFEVKEIGEDYNVVGDYYTETIIPYYWADALEVFFDDEGEVCGYGTDWVQIEKTADFDRRSDSINNYYWI